jgi:phage shock protein PspC (stress-responsive transcriptional regulator)
MLVNRRLYRCRHDQRIAGVASGLAEYFDADPSLVRILFILSIFLGGAGLLLYIAMAIIVPLEPEEMNVAVDPETGDVAGEGAVAAPTGWHTTPARHRHAARGNGRAMTIFGVILILFGGLALIDALLPAWADSGRFLWPAFLVGIGALLIVSAVRREPTESTQP